MKIFMAPENTFAMGNVLVFLANWIFFTYTTSGTAVPCGIFLPCMLIGCAVGQVYYHFHGLMFSICEAGVKRSDHMCINPETMSILGAAAVLSGATRMTYCLAVIMLETTSNVELFLPIIFTLFMSYGSGVILQSRSIYKGALRSKNIPILNKSVPKANRNILATKIMTAPPIHFNFIATVEQVYYQLDHSKFSGFPVVNSTGQVIGIIERDSLIALIEKHAWYTLPISGSSAEE